MILFVVILRRFIYEGTIQTSKIDSISQIYQIMVVSMLKNLSRRYYSHYIIKFVSFMLIYYVININIIYMPIYYAIKMNIVSIFMVFSNLYIGSIDLLQV